MTNNSILWRRLDRHGHESARILIRADLWNLHGTAVFAHEQLPCRLDYHIVCDSCWHTQSAKVAGWVGNSPIEIAIAVSRERRWRLNEAECPGVAGCVDLDLNFSPATNLLPIRRLELAVGQEGEVRAAWLRFPGLKLEPLEQRYKRIDQNTYRYESGGGEFVAQLSVNEDGFVAKYPNFWEVEQG
ncbi:MAG TPA: putative glycolipid-binding domain-containing protein [Pyrinomonadaceae bacterium]|nr:putative glycolipid-binding domain-containing protein [Pyrinomonadaceae bacterium]